MRILTYCPTTVSCRHFQNIFICVVVLRTHFSQSLHSCPKELNLFELFVLAFFSSAGFPCPPVAGVVFLSPSPSPPSLNRFAFLYTSVDFGCSNFSLSPSPPSLNRFPPLGLRLRPRPPRSPPRSKPPSLISSVAFSGRSPVGLSPRPCPRPPRLGRTSVLSGSFVSCCSSYSSGCLARSSRYSASYSS